MTTTSLLKAISKKLDSISAPAPEVMDTKQAAKYLKVSTTFLYHNTTIPKYSIEKSFVRYRKSDLDAWLNKYRVSTKDEINEKAENYLLKKAK